MCYVKDYKSIFKQISSELMYMQAVQWDNAQLYWVYLWAEDHSYIIYVCHSELGMQKSSDKMRLKGIIWGRVLGRVPIRIIYSGSLDHLEEVI